MRFSYRAFPQAVTSFLAATFVLGCAAGAFAQDDAATGSSTMRPVIRGVVDAWYLLLDRWGTMSFEQVLQPAIQLAEDGFPLSERLARAIANARKIHQYPSTMRVYMPAGQAPQPGDVFKNVDLARTL